MVVKQVDIKVNSNLGQAAQDAEDLAKSINSATTATDKLNKETQQSGKGATSIRSIADAAGELSPAFGNATGAMQGALKTMWLIVANPIGAVIAAIVLGLTALFKAFQSTDEGADLLEQTMAGLSNVLTVIRDRVLKFADAYVKFFSGDFKGALKTAKEAVSGFGSEIADEFRKGAEAAKLLQEVEDAMVSLGVTRAKLNRDLARSKELLTDENATYAEKKKAIEDIRQAEGAYTEEALANARKRLRAAQLDRKLSGDERNKAIADAKIAVLELETESAQVQRSANRQQKALNAQLAADQKEKHDAYLAKLKEREEKEKEHYQKLLKEADEFFKNAADAEIKAKEDLQKEIDNLNKNLPEDPFQKELRKQKEVLNATYENNDLKLQAIIDYNSSLLENEMLTEEERTALQKVNSEARTKIAETEAEARVQAAQFAANALGVVSDLIGRDSAEGKAVAIAATTIATYAAAQQAFLQAQKNPISVIGPAYPYIQAGLAIVQGLNQVKQIASVKLPKGGGGGGGSAPSGGGSAAAVPNFNVVGNSGVNQLAGVIAGKEQTPVKAYVVTREVTSGQSLDRNTIDGASLG